MLADGNEQSVVQATSQIDPATLRIIQDLDRKRLWSYYIKSHPVWAYKVENEQTVQSATGSQQVGPGHWVYTELHTPNQPFVMSEHDFLLRYKPTQIKQGHTTKCIPLATMPGIYAARLNQDVTVKTKSGDINVKRGAYLCKHTREPTDDLFVVESSVLMAKYNKILSTEDTRAMNNFVKTASGQSMSGVNLHF